MTRNISKEVQNNIPEAGEGEVANRQSVLSDERPAWKTEKERGIKRYTILLSKKDFDGLKEISDREGRPVVDIVRQALKLYLRIREELIQGTELIKIDESGKEVRLELIFG